ncbi:myocardin-like isoform X2 [Coregonus clupeaformis]|uniref:myocardin-like isoform X2 n=1 Tax=Coregonus clupeaformis TaxID=59861 RepID=UPI001E1C7D05|nr:myocardin-like isoform X2 [Coregonus clupeaformis]
MTLLASERSLLIRNKFRSVLQLRIQNRRQNEIDSGDKDQSKALRLTDNGATQKSRRCGLNTKTAQDRSVCGAGRQKKARLADDLGEKIQRRPGPLELLHKHILPPENRPVSFSLSSDVFQDDISSCSSSLSPEQLRVLQSPALSSSPGLSDDQSLSDLSPGVSPLTHSTAHAQSILALLPATEGIRQPMCMTVGDSNSMATTGTLKGMYLTSHATPLLPKTARSLTPPADSSSLTPSLTSSRPPRPRKTRDSQPKMKKLKYHQYIPPDQRGTTGTAGGGASQRSPIPAQPIDPAYPSLLQQQQVFLQLQILQNQQQQQQQQDQQQQQQLTVTPSGDTNQIMRFSGATPQNPQPVSKATNPTPVDTSPSHTSELLPPNLVDLTVSELRQQLRKRGLPVSGTKPSLLQRLRPFQLPHLCLTPVPLCQLGTSLEPLTPSSLLTPTHNPSSSPGSGPDSPTNSPNHQVYIQSTGILSGVRNGIVNGIPNGIPNGIVVSVVGEQCGFLAPALTPSSTPSPGLPPCSSSPLLTAASWRSEQEQQELSLELEMRERMRSRPRERLSPPLSLSCGGSLHPFLQQDPGWPRGTPETDGQTEILFTQSFCCQPCDVIGQDFELPMQITASPIQASPSVRSLEEELQEAINRVLMDPSQSIDDILDEPTICVDSHSSSVSELQSPVTILPSPSPPPQTDQSQPFRCHSKDDNFLSSPLCSSLLLELPPSPSTMGPRQAAPPPLPPSICTSPPPPTVTSRKRRAQATFDPGDWLESLTSGQRPLSPPSAPFVETDFGLNSDLNVNRALDLMVEQW